MSAKPDPDLAVIERYGNLSAQPFSYPEVLTLLESFNDRDFRDHIERGNAELIPKPVSLFLHVPKLEGRAELYVEQLLREIELISPLIDQDRDVTWVQWSGAPDQLSHALSDRVLASIDRRFHIANSAIFVQCFDMDSTAVDISRLGKCHKVNSCSLQVRMTFGKRQQSPDGFASTIRSVCDSQPDRIHLVDGALLLQDEPPLSSMDATTRIALLEQAVGCVNTMGYTHVYKDSFDLDGQNRIAVDSDIIGLGPGAISITGDAVIQSASRNEDWQSALDARRLPVSCGRPLAREERLRVELLQHLLRGKEVEADSLANCSAIGLDATRKLLALEEYDLVHTLENRVAATSRGRYLWRILAQCLDPDPQRRGHVVSHDGHNTEKRSRGGAAQ